MSKITKDTMKTVKYRVAVHYYFVIFCETTMAYNLGILTSLKGEGGQIKGGESPQFQEVEKQRKKVPRCRMNTTF